VLSADPDESVVGTEGTPDIEKVKPFLYVPQAGTYHEIGSDRGRAHSIGNANRRNKGSGNRLRSFVLTENLLHDRRQVQERFLPVPPEGRSMHDREGLGLQASQLPHEALCAHRIRGGVQQLR
jgi:hypothetical protein